MENILNEKQTKIKKEAPLKSKKDKHIDLLKKNLKWISLLAFIGGFLVLLSSADMLYRFTSPQRLAAFISDGFIGTNKSKFYFNAIHFYGILLGYVGAIIILLYAVLMLAYIFINKAYKRFLWGVTIVNAFIAIILAISMLVLLTQVLYEIRTTKFSIGEDGYNFKPASWVTKAIGGVISIKAIGGKMDYTIWVVVIVMVYILLGGLLFISSTITLLSGWKLISPEIIKEVNHKKLAKKMIKREARQVKRLARNEKKAELFIARENEIYQHRISQVSEGKTRKFKSKNSLSKNNKE